MNRAFIFPGQGSQLVGMGKVFYENFSVAKEVFDEVDDALSEKLSSLIFEGTDEELTLTSNTQPALMAVSLAILRTIEYLSGKKIIDMSTIVAGHSLGEYSAICAAGGLSIRDCARLLRLRGAFMQNACREGEGAMAAIIGARREDLQFALKEANSYGICELANDNSKDQVVISGNVAAVDFAMSMFGGTGVKAIKLKVSAPFHCSLMKDASERMKEAMSKVKFNRLSIPVIDNVSLELSEDPEFLKERLIEQISGTVRWRETMEIIASSYDSAYEVGSGKVLSSLFKRSYPEFKAQTLNTIAEAEEFVVLLHKSDLL